MMDAAWDKKQKRRMAALKKHSIDSAYEIDGEARTRELPPHGRIRRHDPVGMNVKATVRVGDQVRHWGGDNLEDAFDFVDTALGELMAELGIEA